MNFCIYCRFELNGNERFCPSCGKNLQNIHIKVPQKNNSSISLSSSDSDLSASILESTSISQSIYNSLKDSELESLKKSLIQSNEKSLSLFMQKSLEASQNASRSEVVSTSASISTSILNSAETEKNIKNSQSKSQSLSISESIKNSKSISLQDSIRKEVGESIRESLSLASSEFEKNSNSKTSEKAISSLSLTHNSPVKKSSDTRNLDEKTRIYLGRRTSGAGKPIYWEYGNPQLANKHMLVTGKSGQGKTYFMQTLLLELSKKNVSSLVIDYTDSYLPGELDKKFVEKMGSKLEEIIVVQTKLPINPFKIQSRTISKLELTEQPQDMVDRVIEVIDFIFKLGVQQKALARRIMLAGYTEEPNNYTFTKFKENLLQTSDGEKVYNRLSVLLDRDPFTYEKEFDWSTYFNYEGKVTVIQMVQFQRQLQNVMTEFLLWDIFNHSQASDDGALYPVFLDEIQNLNFSPSSPVVKILREGRKFGWSGIFATQAMSSIKGEVDALYNAAEQIHFLPPEDQVSSLASYIASKPNDKAVFSSRLRSLKKGQCLVCGQIYDPNFDANNLYKTERIISIDSIENR